MQRACWRLTVAAAAVCALAVTPAHAAERAIPDDGVLVVGTSLGGVHLGDPARKVSARFGAYTVCGWCDRPTWFFTNDQALGLGVVLDVNRRVAAVYTLGALPGWHTREGLAIGAPVQGIVEIYGQDLRTSTCIGYVAWSTRSRRAVTSFYSDGDSVYGFALTRPHEDVCA